MNIIYKRGDVMNGPEKFLLHGCNAQCVMGAGVARLVRMKYPSAFRVYQASASRGGMRLGVVTLATQDNGVTVFNGITQENCGSDGKQYVDYEAVREVCKAVAYYLAQEYPDAICEVAMPKIGAGLGGGDWNIIAQIIEEESINFQPVVYTL